MPVTDPREAELIEVVAEVIVGLVVEHLRVNVTHQHVDLREIGGLLMRLLPAVARYTNSLAERPSDEALLRAVAMLG